MKKEVQKIIALNDCKILRDFGACKYEIACPKIKCSASYICTMEAGREFSEKARDPKFLKKYDLTLKEEMAPKQLTSLAIADFLSSKEGVSFLKNPAVVISLENDTLETIASTGDRSLAERNHSQEKILRETQASAEMFFWG